MRKSFEEFYKQIRKEKEATHKECSFNMDLSRQDSLRDSSEEDCNSDQSGETESNNEVELRNNKRQADDTRELQRNEKYR